MIVKHALNVLRLLLLRVIVTCRPIGGWYVAGYLINISLGEDKEEHDSYLQWQVFNGEFNQTV